MLAYLDLACTHARAALISPCAGQSGDHSAQLSLRGRLNGFFEPVVQRHNRGAIERDWRSYLDRGGTAQASENDWYRGPAIAIFQGRCRFHIGNDRRKERDARSLSIHYLFVGPWKRIRILRCGRRGWFTRGVV